MSGVNGTWQPSAPERPDGRGWRYAAANIGKAAAYLALFLGWQMFVSMVYTIVATAQFGPEGAYGAVMGQSMEISLLSNLLTLASAAAFFLVRRKHVLREVGVRPASPRVVLWGALTAFCLYWLVMLVLNLLPEQWMEGYTQASQALDDTGALAFFAVAIVGPVTEEVVFRGLIFSRLRRAMHPWLAVVLASAVFALCHGQAVWICYTFVVGFVFTAVAEGAGSIVPSMVMHIVFNATNEVMALCEGSMPAWLPLAMGVPLATVGLGVCAVFLVRAIKASPRESDAG